MRRETIHGYLLLLPALVLLVAFTHWPAIATLIDSFYATPHGSRPAPFVGIDNYSDLINDPVFWQALRNNAWYALATIPTSIMLALLMALAVNEALPGRALLRMAYFLPTMLPMIAVANIWMFFYTPDYGLFDRIVEDSQHQIGRIGERRPVSSVQHAPSSKGASPPYRSLLTPPRPRPRARSSRLSPYRCARPGFVTGIVVSPLPMGRPASVGNVSDRGYRSPALIRDGRWHDLPGERPTVQPYRA